MSDTPADTPPTPRTGAPASAPLVALLEDQRQRWRLGQRVPVEAYLEQQAALRDDADRLLDLIYQEVLLRGQAGEMPQLDEYLGRFPQLASQLRVQFELEPVFRASSSALPAPAEDGADHPPDSGEASDVALPRVAGYEVLGVLGRGGMGVVYRARQVALKRLVALKMIRAGDAADPEQRARFQAEAEAVARLQHPHIVQVYEVAEHDGRPLLALEYVAGGSLADRLRGTPQPPADAARLVETLARAVDHAHRHGVIHRDLKPANVLLSFSREPPASAGDAALAGGSRLNDSVPKVTDFGLAKLLDTTEGDTKSGSILGTPSYMAPEQAAGKAREIGPAADIYALGAVLYELLTGRPPFRAATVLETLEQVRTQDPVPPRRLQPRLPRDLETICLKCLEKEPAKRYETAADLADDLGRFLRLEPVRARPVGAVVRLGRWARRNPKVAALLLVLAVVLLAGVTSTTLLWQRSEFQRHQAEVNLDTAEANFRAAFEAVDRYYTQVSENRLLHEPGMKSLRRDLLTGAREFLDRFAAERQGDPRVRQERAQAVRRLAWIAHELDSLPRALDLWEQARELFTDLARDDPDNAKFSTSVAECHLNLGQLHRELGNLGPAQEAVARALAIWEELDRTHPGTEDHRNNLAVAHGELGVIQQLAGRAREAEAAFGKAVAIQQELAEARPRDSARRQELAVALFRLADAAFRAGAFDRAAPVFERANALWERLVQEHPRDTRFRRDLAAGLASLGNVYQALGRFPEAEVVMRRAAAVWERLVQADADVPAHERDLAAVRHNLSNVLRFTNRLAEAEAVAQEALKARRRLAAVYPDNVEFAVDLAMSYRDLAVLANTCKQPTAVIAWNGEALRTAEQILQRHPGQGTARNLAVAAAGGRAQVLAGQGQHAAALPDWDKALALDGPGPRRTLLRTYRAISLAHVGEYARADQDVAAVREGQPKEAERWSELARAEALCAAAVLRDAGIPTADRPKRAEPYAAQAVALLTRAREAGYFREPANAAGLHGDDWHALRSRPDFQQLLRDVGAPGQRTP
jgi:eukaryotic-like serine/threonine-protein kinase